MTPTVEYYKDEKLVRTTQLKDRVNIRDQGSEIEMDIGDALLFAIGVIMARPDKIVVKPDILEVVTEVIGDNIERVGRDGVSIRLKELRFRKASIMSFF